MQSTTFEPSSAVYTSALPKQVQTSDSVVNSCEFALYSGGTPIAMLSSHAPPCQNRSSSALWPNGSTLLDNGTWVSGNGSVLADIYNCSESGLRAPPSRADISWDDATWILTSSFIIFTMQSGFGLLESGAVSSKNEVNIMVKNAVDVIFGGISFWMFGFGIVFDDETLPPESKNSFTGVGPFFVDAGPDNMGYIFSCFIFQLSFSTTATTIVSGAMVERTKLVSYIIFSFANTAVYSFPAYWIWAPRGFLRQMGAVDIAGASAVHLVGGVTGLAATILLKPRYGMFKPEEEGGRGNKNEMGCPTNSLLGMFMLWWGWLGFNCGSTFGISGGKWKLAARSAVATVLSSMGGGCIGLLFSFVVNNRKFDVADMVNGILASLVSVTAICAIAHPWESLAIGAIGGLMAVPVPRLLEKLKIDDPVGVIPVHGVASVWAMLAVGLFVEKDNIQCLTYGRAGLLRGGGFYLLGVQLLAVLCVVCWTLLVAVPLLLVIHLTFGLRMNEEDEKLGADFVEHGISPCSVNFPTMIVHHNTSNCNIGQYCGKHLTANGRAADGEVGLPENGVQGSGPQHGSDTGIGGGRGSSQSQQSLPSVRKYLGTRRRSLGVRQDDPHPFYQERSPNATWSRQRSEASVDSIYMEMKNTKPADVEHGGGSKDGTYAYSNPVNICDEQDEITVRL